MEATSPVSMELLQHISAPRTKDNREKSFPSDLFSLEPMSPNLPFLLFGAKLRRWPLISKVSFKTSTWNTHKGHKNSSITKGKQHCNERYSIRSLRNTLCNVGPSLALSLPVDATTAWPYERQGKACSPHSVQTPPLEFPLCLRLLSSCDVGVFHQVTYLLRDHLDIIYTWPFSPHELMHKSSKESHTVVIIVAVRLEHVFRRPGYEVEPTGTWGPATLVSVTGWSIL